MDKIVIASMRKNAGKTSLIAGLAKASGRKIAYMKPFGDRLIYKKKSLWDYDTALMTKIFALEDNPEDMCFGFDHSKLKYMYSGDGTKEKLLESVETLSKGKELLLIEGGKDLMYGTYVHLGSLSIAKHTGAKLVVVVSGDHDQIVDDIAFLKKYIDRKDLDLAGVIINKLKKPEEFKENQAAQIEEMGINILGMIPYEGSLTNLSVSYLADTLFAKVITGEDNIDRKVKSILIGAMSVDAPLQKIFSERKEKLVITSGDRSDMLLAALESDTSAIVVTNNILPAPHIISKAEEKGIPMLLVPFDTYKTSKQIDELEPLLTKSDSAQIDLLSKLARENVDLKAIL